MTTPPVVHHPAWSGGDGNVGVLVLHGFTGNPWSVLPWAHALVDAGHRVEVPRLPGHGTTWQDMAGTTWHDWAGEAIAAYDRLRLDTTTQVVAGLSMGGTLALHLAETRGDELAGLVLVNPSLQHRDPRNALLGVLKRVLPSLPGVGSDIARPGGDEQAYDRVPLHAYASLLELQRHVRERLDRVRCPTLVFTSRTDHVVDSRDSDRVVAEVGAPVEQVMLERSWHVATLDHDAGLINERTAAFVREVAAGRIP